MKVSAPVKAPQRIRIRKGRSREKSNRTLEKHKGAAPIYDDVGFVKRHVDCARREARFFLPEKNLFSFLHFDQRLAR